MLKKSLKIIFIILEVIILTWMVWYCCADVLASDLVSFGDKFSIDLTRKFNLHFFTVKLKAVIIAVNVIVYLSYIRYQVYYYTHINKKKKSKYRYK